MHPGLSYPVLAIGLLLAAFVPSSSLPPPPQDRGDFVLEAGSHDLLDVIDRAAAFLGRNYLYSATETQHVPELEIRLQNRIVADATGCEEVVSQLAYAKGFVMVPIDEQRGIYEWIWIAGPKRPEIGTSSVPMSPEEVVRSAHRQIPVLTNVPLSHIDANYAQNTLRPFFMGSGAAAPNGIQLGVAGNSILIQGLASKVAAAIRLIREVDVASQPAGEERLWREQIEQRLGRLEATLATQVKPAEQDKR